MGKTFTRDERKNNKYISRDEERELKQKNYSTESVPRREKPRQKWQPHSEIEID